MRLSESQKAFLEQSTQRYEKQLPQVLPYLRSRGISEDTARHFRLGYVDEPEDHEPHFRGRLCIPYLRRLGVIDQRFRALDGTEPKYRGRPGFDTGLFNVEPFFGGSDRVVITEGELDTVVLHQLGVPSVGIPGAAAWKPHYRRLFEDFEYVYVFADAGEAGKQLWRAVRSDFPYAILRRMPNDDVNTTYLDPEYGPDYLRELISDKVYEQDEPAVPEGSDPPCPF